jgi:phosphoglycerate dehydrogenase-like enzyme
LVTALRNQTVAGAALDAYVHEPLPADHPLMQLPNVVMSPRAGASTVEATEASLGAAIDAVLMFIRAEDAPGGDA